VGIYATESVEGGTHHVLSGVVHPQANGKTGRFNEARARLDTSADVGEFVAWWNTAKPHRTIDFKAGEMLYEAFEARMPPTEKKEVVMNVATGEAYRVHRESLLGSEGSPDGSQGGPHRRGNDFWNRQQK